MILKFYLIRFKGILRSRFFFKILAILLLIYALINTNFNKNISKYSGDTTVIEAVVIKKKISNNKLQLTILGKEKLIAVYYFDDINDISNIYLGDTIRIMGNLDKPLNSTIPNLFNYKKYLEHKKIYYIFNVKKITKIKNNTSLLYYFKNNIYKRIDKITKSSSYLKTFVLGDKIDIEEDILNTYSNLGILHLFSISGMHLNLFIGILLFFLNKVSYNKRINYLIISIFLIIYMLIIGISASILRAILMFIVFSINKLYNLKIKKIDLMLIVLIIVIIINPMFIYDLGFKFSYLISFSIILFNKKIKKIKNKILKSLYVSYLCFSVSFPICITNFYQVNAISIFLNIIMIPLVSIIIFPLSLITFIFPSLDNILYFFIKIMENITLIADKIEISKLVFSKPSLIIIVIYYIAIFISLIDKKYLIIFITILIIHKNIVYFNSNLNITFLSVGQGDSCLIKFPLNKGNILIDTGGIYDSDYSIIKNKTIPYLKSIGINKINYLIITHGDYDHMGEAIKLVNNFKVEKVIFNCGEFNDLEQELIKVLDKKKIKYYSCIKELNIDKNKLYFLQTKEYDNENDNSNVIYTEINGYKFMFMGDAGVEKEKDILDKYNLSNIDVLKVGHHGSRTSSSDKFINELNPKYSVISVGKNNRYGHPNKEVINNLEDSKIYRTDIDGSIMFKIKNNKLKIDTCSP